jgi:photosystem II stability/assembly factor-like uncharacterized protein
MGECLMDSERTGRRGSRDLARSRLVFAVAFSAVAFVVVGLVIRSGPGGGVPVSSPAPSPLTSSPRSSTTALQPASPSGPAAADDAGTFPGGGLWAIDGARLFVSTDAGGSWRESPIPVTASGVPTAFVLDAAHAWSITPGPGTTDFTGSPSDVLHLTVHRTADGGPTWEADNVPGNYPGTSQWLVFVDAQRGYLLCSAERHSGGTSTVLRTDDGGATWSVAGTSSWLGSMFSVSAARTLWAGANEEAGPVSHPLLDVSRDGGQSWRDARLPGLEGQMGGADRWLVGPPLFVDTDRGLVMVASANANGDPATRIYRTDDGGGSWTLAADMLVEASADPAMLDDRHWLLPIVDPLGLLVTADAGTTWQRRAPVGGPASAMSEWIGAVDASHAAALVTTDNAGAAALYQSADGGSTWRTAGHE